MALAAATVWEVRPGVGASTNGGGFVTGASGTDYSQQTSPQYALTGLASAGAGSTLLYASASADMVGNIANLVSGTNATVGYYQITSVSVGVSITFDRAVTTGVGASIVLNIGGALDLISTLLLLLVTGNIVYVKASGTITTTVAMLMPTIGSNFTAIQFIGYTSTRGDNGRVTITTSTNSIIMIKAAVSTGVFGFTWSNFAFSSTAGTPGPCVSTAPSGAGPAAAWSFINCKMSGFSIGIYADDDANTYAFYSLLVVNSEIASCTSHGIAVAGNVWVMGSYLHDNTGNGLVTATPQQNATAYLENTIVYNNGTIGVRIANGNAPYTTTFMSLILKNCAIINNAGSGVSIEGGQGATLIAWNNIFDTNTGYGVSIKDIASPTQWDARCNFYRGNTTAARNQFPVGAGDQTGTADPFVARGSANFALNNNAGGGQSCRGNGFPGVLTVGGTGICDIGPLESGAGGGGGGNTTFIQQVVNRYVTED